MIGVSLKYMMYTYDKQNKKKIQPLIQHSAAATDALISAL